MTAAIRIPPRARHLVPALLLLPLLAAAAVAEPPVIRNEQPLHPPQTFELEEIWREGGEDSDFVFGMLIDSGVDADGNVYLLDNQLANVEVFAPDGEHLRTVSRRGEGPGEVSNPIALMMLPGPELGLAELFPGKVEKLTLTGEPLGTVTFTGGEEVATGFIITVGCDFRAGAYMLSGMRGTFSDAGQMRTHYVAAHAPTGEETVRYSQTEALLAFNPPTFVEHELLPAFWFGNAIGPDGRIYLADARDDYTVQVHAPDGTLLHTVARTFENLRRDDRGRRRMQAMVDAWYTGLPAEVECTFADHEPAITEIFVDDDDVLWVQHSRSGIDQPAGVLLTFDTFDTEGRWLRQVSFACEGDAAYDGLHFLGGDRVLLVKGYVLARWASLSPGARADFGEDKAGEMEVVYCRLVAR